MNFFFHFHQWLDLSYKLLGCTWTQILMIDSMDRKCFVETFLFVCLLLFVLLMVLLSLSLLFVVKKQAQWIHVSATTNRSFFFALIHESIDRLIFEASWPSFSWEKKKRKTSHIHVQRNYCVPYIQIALEYIDFYYILLYYFYLS